MSFGTFEWYLNLSTLATMSFSAGKDEFYIKPRKESTNKKYQKKMLLWKVCFLHHYFYSSEFDYLLNILIGILLEYKLISTFDFERRDLLCREFLPGNYFSSYILFYMFFHLFHFKMCTYIRCSRREKKIKLFQNRCKLEIFQVMEKRSQCDPKKFQAVSQEIAQISR